MRTTKETPRDGRCMPKGPVTDWQVAQRNARIYNLYAFGRGGKRFTQAELAEQFDLTQGSISQIVRNPQSHLCAA